MFKKIWNNFHNLKLKYKILLCIVSISTACLLLISASCYKYLSDTYEQDTIDNTNYTLDIGASNLNDELEDIFLNANKFISISKVSSIIESFSYESDIKKYVERYNYIQDPLQSYIQTNSYIDSIVLIGKNGDFYGISDIGWKHDIDNLFENEFKDTEGIMILPAQKNPLTKLNMVIPVIIPISTLEDGGKRPIISGTVEEATGNLVIYLDADIISKNLTKIKNSPDSIIYIADEFGDPLNLETDSPIYNMANNDEFKNNITQTGVKTHFTLNRNSDNYIVMIEDIGICDLKLISVTSKNKLLEGLDTIKTFILTIWSISIVISIILSFLLSDFITRTIRKLTKDVQHIEKGDYQIEDSKTTDEVGRLRDSINSMYLTIQEQIELIKEEAEERAKAEINILSEQINPHFLYNTLDCINWEILSGEKDTASNMIGSLSDFLRIGLSHGAQTITFENEISHVESYLFIINQRSDLKIKLVYDIEDKLKNYQIVKLILQPLVENSIKHGFGNVDFNSMGIIPTIEIEIKQIENEVIILVSDNGVGIDISRAKKQLYISSTEETSNHVGLNNIYRRLQSYYGELVGFEFYTIPFYKNTVKIIIPNKAAKN